MDHSTVNQWLGNALSIGAIGATFMGFLPGIAAVVAMVWYLIQIYESATVQRWMATHRVRRLAKLKSRVIMLEAHSRAAALPSSEPDDSGMPMN